MRADYPVLLDACVLIPPALCDLLLRLAEAPRLYLPRWSQEVLEEVRRNQIEKLGWEERLADYWREQVTSAFPEALVKGYHGLLGVAGNDPKDRHVLAAAIRSGCYTIVTDNLRDFPKEALDPWGIVAVGAGDYLTTLYEMEPAVVLSKVDDMAAKRRKSRGEILGLLERRVPGFTQAIASDLQIVIEKKL